jgi:phage terminase small subunit
LTVQQDDFARALAKGMSQADAAIKAGYAPKYAESIGCRLSRNVKVTELVASLRNKVAQKVEVDLAFVIGGLRENALRCQTAVPVLDEDGEPIGEYKFDASGSNRAFELLGKHLGAFIDRSQIELSDGTRRHIERIVQIIVDEVDAETAGRIIGRITGESGGGDAHR